MPCGLVLEQSCVAVHCSTRKVLKLSCMHISSALPGLSRSYQLRSFVRCFSEEVDQVLAQDDSVI